MKISGVRGEDLSLNAAVRAPPARVAVPSPAPASARADTAFSRALTGLAREIDVGGRRIAGASQLHSYDTGTLIALQVGIYRYTEAVDLASKIVDRATNAVRSVLQGGGH